MNERLAYASASLQSSKMSTLGVAEARPQMAAGLNARRSAHFPAKPSSAKLGGSLPAAHPRGVTSGLTLEGQHLQSGNERLGMILSELMR